MKLFRMAYQTALSPALKTVMSLFLRICHSVTRPMFGLRVACIPLSLLVLGFAHSAGAATITWMGVLRVVVEDTGLGIYTGGTQGVSKFSGSFSYGDTCGNGCLEEPFPPDEINYVFESGTGTLTGLGVTTVGVESSVAINNDEVIDSDEAALFDVFGITVAVGSTFDVWSVASENEDDAIEDAGIEWEVAFVYLTTNPFSDRSYTATPPPNPDLLIFQVDEGDEETYFAFGEVTIVPVPAAVWLFGSGLFGLVGMARMKA